MSEKKYVVPKEMIHVAYEHCPASFAWEAVESMLEAALKWLSEYGPTISLEEATSLYDYEVQQDRIKHVSRKPMQYVRSVTDNWYRRMFLAPEPEYPDDVLELLRTHPKQAADVIIAAYRCGQKAGAK